MTGNTTSTDDTGGECTDVKRTRAWTWPTIALALDAALVAFIAATATGRMEWGAVPQTLTVPFLAAVATANAKAFGKSPKDFAKRLFGK